MLIDFASQFENVLLPIYVNPSGSRIELKCEPSNARFSMFLTLSGIHRPLLLLPLYEKASLPIVVTGSPWILEGISITLPLKLLESLNPVILTSLSFSRSNSRSDSEIITRPVFFWAKTIAARHNRRMETKCFFIIAPYPPYFF